MAPRRILFILIMAGTVLISYFYSRQVYTFYLDIYYHVYKGYSEEDMIRQGYQLYKDRDSDALQDHARKLQLLYPDSPEASLLSGMALLKKGDYERGLSYLAIGIEHGNPPSAVINDAVALMFQDRYYGEILSVMKNRKSTNADTLYYYGIALYKQERYPEAFRKLKEAIHHGKKAPLTYFYAARACDKTGKTREAVKYMEHAHALARNEPAVASALIDLYRRLGMIEKAEKIVRSQKKFR